MLCDFTQTPSRVQRWTRGLREAAGRLTRPRWGGQGGAGQGHHGPALGLLSVKVGLMDATEAVRGKQTQVGPGICPEQLGELRCCFVGCEGSWEEQVGTEEGLRCRETC